jgi:Na+-transporting NADH:ubiquinone oxidoreductase subunit B
MKALRNLVDKMKPAFAKGGKLEKLHWVFDGLETFLFTPGHATERGAHIRDGIDMKRTMSVVIIAMLPCLLFGMWNVGHQHFLALGQFAAVGDGLWDKFLFGAIQVLPIVVVSYGVGLGIEFLFCSIKGHPIQEGYLVSGMLIPLVMPVETPLWMVAIGAAFAVVIGKEVFGGTGMNVVNVALTARAFLFFAYPTMMSGDKVWVNLDTEPGQSVVDGFSGATSLGYAAIGDADKIASPLRFVLGLRGGQHRRDQRLRLPDRRGHPVLFTGIGSWRIMSVATLRSAWRRHGLRIQRSSARTPYMQHPGRAPAGDGRLPVRPGLHGHRPGDWCPDEYRQVDLRHPHRPAWPCWCAWSTRPIPKA